MIGYHPIFRSFAPILSCSVTVAVCCDMMIGKNGFCRFDGPVQVGTQQPGSNSNNMSANGNSHHYNQRFSDTLTTFSYSFFLCSLS